MSKKKQQKEVSHKRIRAMFNTNSKCIAVRDGHVIYTKGSEQEDGSYALNMETYEKINQAKRRSVEMQLEADGAPRDKDGNFGERYHSLGKGYVLVLA